MRTAVMRAAASLMLVAMVLASSILVTPVSGEPVQSELELRAQMMLNITKNAVYALKYNGLDVSPAEEILSQAMDAYERGEYALATQLCLQAMETLREAARPLREQADSYVYESLKLHVIMDFLEKSMLPQEVKAEILSTINSTSDLENVLREFSANYTAWARTMAFTRSIQIINTAGIGTVGLNISLNITLDITLRTLQQYNSSCLADISDLPPGEAVRIIGELHKLLGVVVVDNRDLIRSAYIGFMDGVYSEAQLKARMILGNLEIAENMLSTVRSADRRAEYEQIISTVENATLEIKEALAELPVDAQAYTKIAEAVAAVEEAEILLEHLSATALPSEAPLINQLRTTIQEFNVLVELFPKDYASIVIVGVVIQKQDNMILVLGYEIGRFQRVEPAVMPPAAWPPIIPVLRFYLVDIENATVTGNVTIGSLVYVSGKITGYLDECPYTLVAADIVSAEPIYWIQAQIQQMLEDTG